VCGAGVAEEFGEKEDWECWDFINDVMLTAPMR